MTERQAWLQMAVETKNRMELQLSEIGLCSILAWLPVSDRIADRMGEHIRRAVKRNGGSAYAWPLSPGGSRARIAFCKRQVARIDRARRKR